MLRNPETNWEDDRYLVHRVGGWLLGKDGQSKQARDSIQNKRFTLMNNEELYDLSFPVILEVMARSDVSTFDHFQAKVKACPMRINGPVLEYETIYGDQMNFDTSASEVPGINGQPVNYAPKKVFESPFLNADWNSGIVTISKGNRKKVLNFESGNSAQGQPQR